MFETKAKMQNCELSVVYVAPEEMQGYRTIKPNQKDKLIKGILPEALSGDSLRLR